MPGPHAVALAKGAISRLLNRHADGGMPAIGLFASRRSGTTIVAQALSVSKAVKQVNQPLSVFTADLVQKTHLPVYAGGFIYDPSEDELKTITNYLSLIISGRLRVSEPWRPWTADFHFKTNRVLFKFTDGHGLVDLLPHVIAMKPIVFFRHPAPQSLSCLTQGWAPRGGGFFRQRALLERYFNQDQVRYIEQAEKTASGFKKHLICWTIENQPLFAAAVEAGRVPFFTYEALLVEPAATLRFLADSVGLPYDDRMTRQLSRPSRSSRHSRTGSEVGAFLAEGNVSRLLDRWRERLSESQREDLNEVMAVLGNPLYDAKAPMPCVMRRDVNDRSA